MLQSDWIHIMLLNRIFCNHLFKIASINAESKDSILLQLSGHREMWHNTTRLQQ